MITKLSLSKKILSLLGLIVCGFLTVIFIRTSQFTSRQIPVEEIPPLEINKEKLARHLSQAIQIQTISYDGRRKINTKEFVRFNQFLTTTFPRIHRQLTKKVISKHSFLYVWEGRNKRLKPILLMGHYDVVPAEEASVDSWTHPPFSGKIADDFIWGRGTLDDKLSVIAIFEAVENLLEEGFIPQRTIYLAIGHDEEIGGKQGAALIAQYLREKDLSFEFILDEGGFVTREIVEGIDAPVALIGVAEKNYLTIELSVEGKGGHSSMPPDKTTIGILSTAIHNLHDHPFPPRISKAVRHMLEFAGAEMSYGRRVALSNLWLFAGFVKKKFTSNRLMNTLIRTTIAPTMIEGGIKENVLPRKARAVINLRVLPGVSAGEVLDYVKKSINDDKVKVKPLNNLMKSSGVSDVESENFQLLMKTVRQVNSDAIVVPWLLVGATDSRHYADLTDNIYRFAYIDATPDILARIHGVDERVSVDNVVETVSFFQHLILNLN